MRAFAIAPTSSTSRIPAARLLLEPLPDITFVGAGGGCKFGRGDRPTLRKSAVKVEPVVDVDGENVPCSEGRVEQLADERVPPLGRVFGGVGVRSVHVEVVPPRQLPGGHDQRLQKQPQAHPPIIHAFMRLKAEY